MAKFYVESGSQFMHVLAAENHADAIMLAFARQCERDEPLDLADMVIVNERGFVWERPDHELYGDEVVLTTRELLGEPQSRIEEL